MNEDLKDWPRDPANGYFLCSPERPMPVTHAKDDTRWAHTGARERDVGLDNDYVRYMECVDCKHKWVEELPE